MSKKMLSLLLVLCLAAGLMLGCTQDGGAGKALDSITVGIDDDCTAMDPLAINDTLTMAVLSNIYEPLVRVDAQTGEIIPGVAESWEVSEDGLEYSFKIREGMTFHNGEELTLEDIKWSVEAQVESSYTGPYISCIDRVDIEGGDTVKIVLAYPYAPFLTLCGTYTYVMKESFYSEGDMSREPIGCGPYKFVSWTSSDKIVLEAFDDYFNGPAPIKNLTFKIIGNQNSAAISLEAGDIDTYMDIAETDVEILQANDELVVDVKPSSAFYFLGMNTKDETMSNEALRQAVAMAVNRDNLVAGVMNGYASVTKSFIAEGLPGYDPDFDPLPYDIEAAKAKLAEAGYPDGLSLTITIPESRSAHAQMIQADLKQIGIELKIDVCESGAFWEDLENGEFQMMIMGWSYVVMDNDVGYYSLYQSDEIVAGNYARVDIPRVDELLKTGRESRGEAERDAIYAEAEELVMGSAAYVPLYWRYSIIAYDKDLKNVVNSPIGMFFIYDYAWAE